MQQLAAILQREINRFPAEDIRVLIVKGELLPLTVEECLVHFTDGEESAVIRLPVPAATAEVIQSTGELVGSLDDDIDPSSDLTGIPDEDFLFG